MRTALRRQRTNPRPQAMPRRSPRIGQTERQQHHRLRLKETTTASYSRLRTPMPYVALTFQCPPAREVRVSLMIPLSLLRRSLTRRTTMFLAVARVSASRHLTMMMISSWLRITRRCDGREAQREARVPTKSGRSWKVSLLGKSERKVCQISGRGCFRQAATRARLRQRSPEILRSLSRSGSWPGTQPLYETSCRHLRTVSSHEDLLQTRARRTN
mmetsp:Transcript_2148/g.4948  ORF Transcript_2148/g.4948 Transcript_2148/m.4948 type:complete len:215 (-) Transcript_2148:168-812(-)